MAAYEAHPSDRQAATSLGIHQATFSAWRRRRLLVAKSPRPGIAEGSKPIGAKGAQYLAARLEHGLEELRRRLAGDAWGQLVLDGLMLDVRALAGGARDTDEAEDAPPKHTEPRIHDETV